MRSFAAIITAAAALLVLPCSSFTLRPCSGACVKQSSPHREDLIISSARSSTLSTTTTTTTTTTTREEEPATTETILRDLEGKPLSNEYFVQAMGIDQVDDYSAEDAFLGLMSNGCRVHLFPGGQTAFFKRIDFNQLEHAFEKLKSAPFKLLRDTKSYQVVANFLASKACRSLKEKTGVQIPECYDAEMQPNYSNPMESKFTFLLQDFSPQDGWYQRWLLDDEEEIQATLCAYAKIHAYFWNGSAFYKDKDAAREFEAAVWESGSYIQPEAQPKDQWKEVAKEWNTKRLKFSSELSSFDYWDNLGERLQSVAEECGHLAHPFASSSSTRLVSEQYRKYRTFTHGDPKQSNLLFRRSSSNDEILQVGLIDFQWAGFGLAATDIAHFLTSAVHADSLVDGGEDKFQRYYFDQLQAYLVEYGAFDTAEDALQKFSYETFIEQYETAVLDIVRLVVAYTWERFDEPVEKDDQAACARTMNKTSYNKSVPNVIWLMSRCDEILKSRGV